MRDPAALVDGVAVAQRFSEARDRPRVTHQGPRRVDGLLPQHPPSGLDPVLRVEADEDEADIASRDEATGLKSGRRHRQHRIADVLAGVVQGEQQGRPPPERCPRVVGPDDASVSARAIGNACLRSRRHRDPGEIVLREARRALGGNQDRRGETEQEDGGWRSHGGPLCPWLAETWVAPLAVLAQG